LHYGRDALVGIALFLSFLAKRKLKCSQLRELYPDYVIAKKKLTLDHGTDIDIILESVRKRFKDHEVDERDGLRIEFEKGWVHIRKSNTEPIIRIYAESISSGDAERLADEVINIVKKL
jgi:phosphomannomutase